MQSNSRKTRRGEICFISEFHRRNVARWKESLRKSEKHLQRMIEQRTSDVKKKKKKNKKINELLMYFVKNRFRGVVLLRNMESFSIDSTLHDAHVS